MDIEPYSQPAQTLTLKERQYLQQALVLQRHCEKQLLRFSQHDFASPALAAYHKRNIELIRWELTREKNESN